jgi:hypothetical protein
VPQRQDREQVKQIVDALCSQNLLRAAAIVLMARATGMRLREAILADLPRLSREAEAFDKINIQGGTKGGRAGASAPRWIAVSDSVRGALEFARQVSPVGSRNLIAPPPKLPECPARNHPPCAGHLACTQPQRPA